MIQINLILLLAIIEAFKTWRHYLEGRKHKVLVLIDYNNLRRFIDTRSLSSCQVRWAKELSRYYFWIDYRQGKANGAADALSRFLQRSLNEEKTLQVKNSQILHRLQSSFPWASLSSLSFSGLSLGSEPNLSPFHQVFICNTHVFPQLSQFWETFWTELAAKLYKASIGGMRLRLAKLQKSDAKT